jgi:hypothetical protein
MGDRFVGLRLVEDEVRASISRRLREARGAAVAGGEVVAVDLASILALEEQGVEIACQPDAPEHEADREERSRHMWCDPGSGT